MQKISKDMIISDLVQIDQNIIPILMREGMHCIGCPSAQAETLEEAALVHGLDPVSYTHLIRIVKRRNHHGLHQK